MAGKMLVVAFASFVVVSHDPDTVCHVNHGVFETMGLLVADRGAPNLGFHDVTKLIAFFVVENKYCLHFWYFMPIIGNNQPGKSS